MRRNNPPYLVVESRKMRALVRVKRLEPDVVTLEIPGGRDVEMVEGDTLNLTWEEPVEEHVYANDRE